jgi:hypothetical protein
VEDIKLLEIELEIVLEVIHVPGTTIITEGTDGLSRGIWCTPLHQRPDRHLLLAEIFAPVPFTRDVGDWAVLEAGFDPGVHWEHRSWELEWRAEDCFDRLTVWAPPPEVAPQLIYDMLQIYVEKPLSTGMLFLIPRVLQRRWSRLICCVLEVGVYPRALVPVSHNSHLTIVSGCSPTGEILYTYFTDGMRRGVGDNPKPSAVLLLYHILWMEKYFEDLFDKAKDCLGRFDACRAALTLVLAYLAWLRALETFGLTWSDVDITNPQDGPTVGLPLGIGDIKLTLLP